MLLNDELFQVKLDLAVNLDLLDDFLDPVGGERRLKDLCEAYPKALLSDFVTDEG